MSMKARGSYPSATGVFLACGVLFAGCGGDGTLSVRFDGAPVVKPIIGGTPAAATEYDAVVALLQVSGEYAEYFCSGTLIRPDVVLSAAHCLDGQRASQVLVGVGPELSNDMKLYKASKLKVHPEYDASAILDDIALVKLSSPVIGVTPIAEAFDGIGLLAGEALDFAGFGQTEDGGSGTRLRVGGELGGDEATQLCYGQRSGGPCFGDSGGPAFVVRDEKMYVAGMTSYGDSACARFGISTRADAYETFIHDFAGAD